jgi:hypothetical protein|tara:strand:- start:2248 stop:2394 length:147 start_codon:yes stop_codon:yes gene_type:complete
MLFENLLDQRPMTNNKPFSSGQRFTARQIHCMVFGWIILTVMAGGKPI